MVIIPTATTAPRLGCNSYPNATVAATVAVLPRLAKPGPSCQEEGNVKKSSCRTHLITTNKLFFSEINLPPQNGILLSKNCCCPPASLLWEDELCSSKGMSCGIEPCRAATPGTNVTVELSTFHVSI